MANNSNDNEIIGLKETIKKLENEVNTLKKEKTDIIRRIDILEKIFLAKDKQINFIIIQRENKSFIIIIVCPITIWNLNMSKTSKYIFILCSY